jgi:hypothetical protein
MASPALPKPSLPRLAAARRRFAATRSPVGSPEIRAIIRKFRLPSSESWRKVAAPSARGASRGALAQLVEHLHGMQGVSGSNPLCSISPPLSRSRCDLRGRSDPEPEDTLAADALASDASRIDFANEVDLSVIPEADRLPTHLHLRRKGSRDAAAELSRAHKDIHRVLTEQARGRNPLASPSRHLAPDRRIEPQSLDLSAADEEPTDGLAGRRVSKRPLERNPRFHKIEGRSLEGWKQEKRPEGEGKEAGGFHGLMGRSSHLGRPASPLP